MSAKISIYISSTYEDLRQCRITVVQALRQAGYDPVGMEDYAAEGNRPLSRCLDDVKDCTVFVGIIAFCYGNIPTESGTKDIELPKATTLGETSFTEYEYRQAVQYKKPILMFLLDPAASWPANKADGNNGSGMNGQRIKLFRDAIMERHLTNFFVDQHSLASQVLASVSKHINTNARNGSQTLPNKAFTKHNLPARNYVELVGRKDELEHILDGLKMNVPVICLQGNDGIGKTSAAVEAGYAYLKSDPDLEPDRYVVWISAKDNRDKNLTLNDIYNTIARVTNYGSLVTFSLDEDPNKKQMIQDILSKERILVIIDDFESISDLAVRDWVRDIPIPSHALLTAQKFSWKPWPNNYMRISLKGLENEHIVRQIHSQAFVLGIQELESKRALQKDINTLITYSKGNPRITELALGNIKGLLESDSSYNFRDALENVTHDNDTQVNEAEHTTDKIFAQHLKAWQDLSIQARCILLSIPLFVDSDLILKEALFFASGISESDFEIAQNQLLNRNLLEFKYEANAYYAQSNTRNFALIELKKLPEFEVKARSRWGNFYLNFVKNNITRTEPDIPYWDSLVSDSMHTIDPEWPAIVEVLNWADQHKKDQLLLTMVMLLTHYMDSRLHNKERIKFTEQAVKAAKRLRLHYEEGLLRIDALGWTYFEENCPLKAYEEILTGLGLIKPLVTSRQDAWELTNLGFAWQARVKMEIALSAISKFESNILKNEAVVLIEKALCIDCNSWIRYRIFKAAGDIAFKANITLKQNKQDKGMLDFYLQAQEEIKKYGGEGANYQIAPRIGLAYLNLNDLTKAKEYFSELCNNHEMPIIGTLYGKYGIALIKHRNGHKEEAEVELKQLENELLRHTASNQLLKMITSFGNNPSA